MLRAPLAPVPVRGHYRGGGERAAQAAG
jgi:hypothetical protein